MRVDISIAIDGEDAVNYLLKQGPHERRETPDLILLDLNLPKMDGREVLAVVKGREELKRVPVVILTSSDADADIVRSYELGANCYITKPVGLDAFQEIVRSVENFWFTVVKLP